jgi:hypothetical protein
MNRVPIGTLGAALDGFIGLPLRAISRIGFTTFSFGEWIETTDRRGRPVDTTDRTNDVDCAWRLVWGRRFFTLESQTEEPPSTVEPVASARLRALIDARMDREELVVADWSLRPGGLLVIGLGSGFSLEAVPTMPSDRFHWRVRVVSTGAALYCCGSRCTIEQWG